MSCKCHGCGCQYKLDLLVSDSLWEEIKPENAKEGAGLLCGKCIISRIESKFGYSSFNIII